jgi:hypothetical protein
VNGGKAVHSNRHHSSWVGSHLATWEVYQNDVVLTVPAERVMFWVEVVVRWFQVLFIQYVMRSRKLNG